MSNASAKTFDAVDMVRTVRDEISTRIASMSVEEENRWLRSEVLEDTTLRRLMELADQQNSAPHRD
jgi:hypothetical protein